MKIPGKKLDLNPPQAREKKKKKKVNKLNDSEFSRTRTPLLCKRMRNNRNLTRFQELKVADLQSPKINDSITAAGPDNLIDMKWDYA